MIKFLFYFFALFTVLGCSKPEDLKKTQWRPGDSIRQLSYLNEITTPVPETISVLNEKIEYSPQVLDGIPLENTFVKKINSEEGALLYVDSVHYENLKNFKQTDTASYKDLKTTKKNILKKFSFLHTKDLSSLSAMIEKSGRIFWTLSYFDHTGQPYLLKFDKDLILYSRAPVGANLFSGSAIIFPLGPKLSSLKEVSLKNLSFSPPLSNPLFKITSASTGVFDKEENILEFAPEDDRFDQVQVYYYLEQAMDWIKNTLKVELKTPLDIQLHIGYPEKTNAAFYYQGKIRLGAGDDIIYSKIAQDPSIVSHEVFHSLIETISRLPFEGEGGSLNEGFADFFTSQLLKRPHLGESSFLQGSFKRSVDNNKKWSDKANLLYGDSLIASGLLWNLSEVIGEEKILVVALKTLARLNPASKFVDFNRECQAALKANLTAKDLSKAIEILDMRGFPRE